MSGRQSANPAETDAIAGARARIPQPDTRQSTQATGAGTEPEESGAVADSDGADESPASFKDAVGASLRSMEPTARKWWFDVLRPPLFWTEGLPAAGESWAYAKAGPWCRSDSPIRVAATVWQVLTTPLRFIAFYASWLTERPSRFLVFITVYALLASTSYASWLPWIW